MSETISLISEQYGLDLHLLFNQAIQTEYGQGWSSSIRQYACPGGSIVSITRGDMTNYSFVVAGTLGGITTYTAQDGAASTLQFDGTTYSEFYPDGSIASYREVSGGELNTYRINSLTDPTGAITTFNNSSFPHSRAACTSIEFPGGKLVTLAYMPELSEPVQLLTVTDFGGRLYTFSFSLSHPPQTFTRPSGCQTQYTYSGTEMTSHTDPMGYLTQFGLSGTAGQPVTVVAGSSVWTHSWGTNTNSSHLPSGALLTYAFDAITSYPTGIHRPQGYTLSQTFDAGGRKVTQTVPAGTIMSWTYHPTFGQVQYQADATGNVASVAFDTLGNKSLVFAPNGSISTATYSAGSGSRRPIHVLDADGATMSYSYYANGRMQSSQDARGLTSTFTYDSFGNHASTALPDGSLITKIYDVHNRLVAYTDQLSRTTSYAYDLADNMIALTNPLGQTTSYVYQNCLMIASVDPLGNRSSYSYDRFRNLVTSMDPLGNVTTNVVDANGYVISTQDPLGNRVTAIFNAARQKVAVVDQLGGYTSYVFDASGRQIATVNQLGYTTSFTLDAQGRQIATIDPLGNITTQGYTPSSVADVEVCIINAISDGGCITCGGGGGGNGCGGGSGGWFPNKPPWKG